MSELAVSRRVARAEAREAKKIMKRLKTVMAPDRKLGKNNVAVSKRELVKAQKALGRLQNELSKLVSVVETLNGGGSN